MAVVVVGLFAGGALAAATKPGPTVVVQSTSNQTGASTSAASNTQGAATGRQTAGPAVAPDQAARPVVGSVASIDADNVTVTTQQGDTRIKLAGAKVTKVADGSTDDLSKGAHVTAMGQQQADGSYVATTVQITPADQARSAVAVQSGGNGGTAQGGGRNQAQAQQGTDTRQRPISGTVSALDAGVMTITTQQGDTKVGIASAHIQKTVDGTPKDLQTGQRVIVTGQPAQDGSYEMAQIQILANSETGSQGTVAGATSGKVR